MIQFSIQSEGLNRAIVEFAEKANISIATPSEGFGNATSSAVVGAFTPQSGLAVLLNGSGFSYERLDAVTFRVLRPARTTFQGSDGPSEILVLATKVPGSVNRAPSSITAIEREYLERSRSRDTNDVAFDVAGVTSTNLGIGLNKILIRGLSDGAFSGRTQSTVGVYIDESPVTFGAPDPDIYLADVDRVEVLRGPQGTLYGSGSIGGIYRIVTRTPDLDASNSAISATVEGTASGGMGSAFDLVLNQPLVRDRWGIRAVGYRQVGAGWLDNPNLHASNTNRTIREGGRVAILGKLNDTWSLGFNAIYQTIDAQDSQYVDQKSHSEARSTQALEPHDNGFGLFNATVKGSLPFGDITSTTSILQHETGISYDATGAFQYIGVAPTAVILFNDHKDSNLFVHETRVVGSSASLPWLVGLSSTIGRLYARGGLASPSGSALSPAPYEFQRVDHIDDAAIFGEATVALGSRLKVTAGIRLFRNRDSMTSTVQERTVGLFDTYANRRTRTGAAPRLALLYQASPRTFYYMQVSTGYRTGGFNAGGLISHPFPGPRLEQPFRSYGSDQLWSLEGGIKSALLSDRLHFRASVFWQIWNNVQTDQLIISGFSFTGNAGDGVSGGFEVEADYQPTDALTLRGNLTYSDSELNSVDPQFPSQTDTRLPGIPHLIAGTSIQYQYPIGAQATAFALIRGHYVGDSDLSFMRSVPHRIGAYAEIDLRTGIDVGSWQGTLYIDNLANTRAATFSFGNPFRFATSEPVTPLRPRTIGLSLARTF